MTPITIETKRSKERRNTYIAKKAEQVKNAFILLHKNHIDDSLVTLVRLHFSNVRNKTEMHLTKNGRESKRSNSFFYFSTCVME